MRERREDRINAGALRGERADRIGGSGVSCEKHGLAAAAPEILRAAVAGFAGLLHPTFAAKFLKCGAGLPDFLHGFFLHIIETQIGNDGGRVTGQSVAARSDEHGFARPASHAGLGKFCVVIGNDIFDFDLAAQAFLGLLEEFE